MKVEASSRWQSASKGDSPQREGFISVALLDSATKKLAKLITLRVAREALSSLGCRKGKAMQQWAIDEMMRASGAERLGWRAGAACTHHPRWLPSWPASARASWFVIASFSHPMCFKQVRIVLLDLRMRLQVAGRRQRPQALSAPPPSGGLSRSGSAHFKWQWLLSITKLSTLATTSCC